MIVTRTFLGTPPFPVAAKAALANSQLRSKSLTCGNVL